MIRQLSLLLAFLGLFPVVATAQELVTGLQSNPIQGNNEKSRKGLSANDTLTLPFFDDFSGRTTFPDPLKWTDNSVFINNTYSDRQITKGVATFDALDDCGKMYESASSTGFVADQLTSKPINLNYLATDNIYFSFLYQAGGLSDSPEPSDSLTLQFFAPADNRWYSVWRAKGYSGSGDFRNVIIPLNNSRFLEKGFRFRFMNYASLSTNQNDPSMIGNCDIWNIDYVRLGKNRNPADTVMTDVAFRLPMRSVLKNHEAMPWKQFRQIYLNEMSNPVISVCYRNNDSIIRNVTRDFQVWDVYSNMEVHSFTAGATNINPRSSVDYKANLIYTFDCDNPDSALFRITCSLKTDEFDPKDNDTLVYYQVFSNYFAFDDGSSEGGYGINGLGSRNAMLAYRFTSFIQDTLRAVAICFNDSYLDANKRAFDLMVWDDNNGIPGDVIYKREGVMVEKSDILNGFYTYFFPDGIMVDGTFYVGWKQRTETFLNAGFDINTPHKGKQLYYLNGSWNESQVNGSVMIRPYVGNPFRLTGTDDVYLNRNETRLWPNPAGEYIMLGIKDLPYAADVYVSVVDMSGHELMKVPYSEKIDIAGLHQGIYIVITTINGRRIGYNRLVKTR
jgi:hypothetical protein